MDWKVISRNVGMALLASAFFMLLSVGVSLADGVDTAFGPLLVSFLITFIVGVFPFIFVRKTPRITLKEGYVIIFLSWTLSFVFGMLPYVLWGGPFTIENAWFESVSGYTTTGATILEDIESLPRSLLFWRSATHFIGGLGVVVFLLLIIPTANPIRLRLTNMELSSLSRVGYSSTVNNTVYAFAFVYAGIGVVAFIVYVLLGMSPFDAINHAMSVCSTGGFSPRNLSIGSYGSVPIEMATIVFMILSSMHFGLIFIALSTRHLKTMFSPVVKFFLMSLLVSSLLVSFSIKIGTAEYNWWDSLRYGTFHTVSVISTTGFAIGDNSIWPNFPNMLLLIVGIMCGCAGSTTGGVKADRVMMLFKSITLQIKKVLHPTYVDEIRLGSRYVREDDLYSQILYIAVYFLIIMASTLLSLIAGVSLDDSFSSSIANISNIGPALGDMGSLGNYNDITPVAKFIFSLDMFLGRVEIYPVFAVVAMVFDKRRRQ